VTARDALRDYAREEVRWIERGAAANKWVSYTHDQTHVIGQRGEYAGKAIMVLQEVIQMAADACDFGETIDPDDLLYKIEEGLA
jgi:hypothetical protein